MSLATDKDKAAITQATATSMGVDVSSVQLKALIQVSANRRRLAGSSADLVAKAILEVVQQVTGGKDPTTVYQQLTAQITKAVESQNFTAILVAVSKALGANSTALAQVNSIVNSDPVIFVPPSPTSAPTNSPDDGSSKALSLNVLAGIIIGAAFGGVLIIGLLLLLRAKADKPNVLVVPASRYNPPDTNSSVPHYELHHRGHNV